MFKRLAYRGLLARLVNAHGVEPAVAHLLARACYPAPRKEDLPLEPRLSPKEAASRVEAWERTKHPSIDELVALVFGQDQMEEVMEFVEISHALRGKGL